MAKIGITKQAAMANMAGEKHPQSFRQMFLNVRDRPATFTAIKNLTEKLECSVDAIIGYFPSPESVGEGMYVNTLINLKQLELLPQFLQSFADRAREFKSWARVLPCSMEDEVFMREHHKSLFNTRVLALTDDESVEVQKAYNEYGGKAQKRFQEGTQRASLAYNGIMMQSDLCKIADPEAVEYMYCSRESRQATISRLSNILRNSKDYNANMWLITPDNERRLIQGNPRWHPEKVFSDSVIAVRNESEAPIFVFWRETPVFMTRLSSNKRDIKTMNELILEAESVSERTNEFTLQILSTMMTRLKTPKLGAFPGEQGFV